LPPSSGLKYVGHEFAKFVKKAVIRPTVCDGGVNFRNPIQTRSKEMGLLRSTLEDYTVSKPRRP
jgi:hypothetical protein